MSKRIKHLRVRAGKSQAEFGRSYDVTREMVGQWERGESRPRQPKLEKMATDYGVTLDWLSGRGPLEEIAADTTQAMVAPPKQPALTFDFSERAPLPKDLPIRGHARAGREGMFIDQGNHWGFATRPESLRGVSDAYAVRVDDESMWPRYVAGNVLAVDPHRRPQPGDNVVIQLLDDQAFIKELVRRTDKTIICRQFNPSENIEYKPSQVKSIHMVVGIDYLER